MAMTPRKARRYLWRDHQRFAEFTGLPFRKPRPLSDQDRGCPARDVDGARR